LPAVQAAELIGTGSYGRAFVQFLDADGANKAREAIHGRMFAGSTVEAAFLQPQEFLDAIAPPEVPPQVPAAETPADVAPAAEAPAPVPEAAEAAPVLAE
jgi:splicing factor U2AF subunit